MGIINEGQQFQTFKYRHRAKGSDFNRLTRDLIKPGVYKGLNLLISGNLIVATSGVAVLNCSFDGNDILAMKIEFQNLHSFGVVSRNTVGNMVFYLTFEYGEVTENYAEFHFARSEDFFPSPITNAIVLGEIVYDWNDGMIEAIGVSYANKTWGSLNANADDTIPDRLIYHHNPDNSNDNNVRWRVSGELLPVGSRTLQYQNFTESVARIPVTNATNTAVIENRLSIGSDLDSTSTSTGALVIQGGVGIVKRLSVGQFDGRVPLGGVIAVVGTRTLTNNTGSPITPPNIPSSGIVSDDGFQRCDGVAVGSGSTLTGFVPKIDDDRFIQGSSSLGLLSSDTGVNNGDNTVTLTMEQIPSHNHTGNTSNQQGITYSVSSSGSHSHISPALAHLGQAGNAPWGTVFVGSATGIGSGTFDTIGAVTANYMKTSESSVSISQSGTLNHTHPIPPDGGLAGVTQAFDIRPKYISAIYLMRVR